MLVLISCGQAKKASPSSVRDSVPTPTATPGNFARIDILRICSPTPSNILVFDSCMQTRIVYNPTTQSNENQQYRKGYVEVSAQVIVGYRKNDGSFVDNYYLKVYLCDGTGNIGTPNTMAYAVPTYTYPSAYSGISDSRCPYYVRAGQPAIKLAEFSGFPIEGTESKFFKIKVYTNPNNEWIDYSWSRIYEARPSMCDSCDFDSYYGYRPGISCYSGQYQVYGDICRSNILLNGFTWVNDVLGFDMQSIYQPTFTVTNTFTRTPTQTYTRVCHFFCVNSHS